MGSHNAGGKTGTQYSTGWPKQCTQMATAPAMQPIILARQLVENEVDVGTAARTARRPAYRMLLGCG
jgi:hypothetical protein